MKTLPYPQSGLRFGKASLLVVCLWAISGGLVAQAQNFSILHYFTGEGDGAYPAFGFSIDSANNLYGTTSDGGIRNCQGGGCGVVFKMSFKRSGWLFDSLYEFRGGGDGALPNGPVTLARSGAVFGPGWGNFEIFELRPSPTRPATAVYAWNIAVLYHFDEAPTGSMVLDAAGNAYGATSDGAFDEGTVYELTFNGSEWISTTLYTFNGGAEGADPEYGVIGDNSGNLYGVTTSGGSANCGTIFELSDTGSGWAKNTLYNFQGTSDGCQPSGGLSRDAAGNLYGNTLYPSYGQGASTVYRLSPSSGGWTLTTLNSFPAGGPVGSLALDRSGNIYGTTNTGGAYGFGSIFKLSPSGVNWTYTSLHDFLCPEEGCGPTGIAIDSTGNLYGMLDSGGRVDFYCNAGCGTVWELTQ